MSALALFEHTRLQKLCPATSLTALPSPTNYARLAPSPDIPAIQSGLAVLIAVNFLGRLVLQLLIQQKRPRSAV